MKDQANQHEPTLTPPRAGLWFVRTAGALIAVWVLLSGKFDAMHLGLGAAGSLAIAASFLRWRSNVPFPYARFFLFVPWHLGQVVLSNLRVTKVALSPQRKIEPAFIERDPIVRSERAMTLLGCGVTLTPGTLTVEIEPGRYLVHSLDDASSDDIERDVMAKRVAEVFDESPREEADRPEREGGGV